MSQILHNIISPVNVEERRNLDIRTGDTVRVHQKIEDKGKTRLQVFEGVVLARKHGKEAGGTFTVRRVSGGVGVEKIYPLYSPMIDKIEIVKRAKVRRSKLYYIREKAAKQIRRQMRRSRFMDLSTESDIESKARAEQEAQEAEAKAQEATATPEATQDESTTETPQDEGTPETPAEEPTTETTEEVSTEPARSEDHSGGEQTETEEK